MPVTPSPLRYPGGKTSLYGFVQTLLAHNNLNDVTYAEPFAGGAGLALKLLFNNDVAEIILNDIDPAIYSFWHCVLNRTDELCQLIENTPITTDEWLIQKDIFTNKGNGNLLRFGFSTFFLNRTNVSGVIKGGIIGGYEQLGKYRMDARFNRNALIEKIQAISAQRGRIRIYNLDVVDFIYTVLPDVNNSFVNFDPPYVKKGGSLYTNFYNPKDHIELGRHIQRYNGTWMLTYDDCTLIRAIYTERQKCLIPINYSAGKVKLAKEIGIICDEIELPPNIELIHTPLDLIVNA